MLLVAILEVEYLVRHSGRAAFVLLSLSSQLLDLVAHFQHCLRSLLTEHQAAACSHLHEFADDSVVLGAELLVAVLRRVLVGQLEFGDHNSVGVRRCLLPSQAFVHREQLLSILLHH